MTRAISNDGQSQRTMPIHRSPGESWHVRRARRADSIRSLDDELQARETARLLSERFRGVIYEVLNPSGAVLTAFQDGRESPPSPPRDQEESMKSLSKPQLRERDELDTKLTQRAQLLRDAVAAFNGAMAESFKDVEAARDAYNQVVVEANEWQSNIVSDMESYQADRSEKWQEGEEGQAYQSWMDAFGEELEELDLPLPEDMESPDLVESPLAERPERPE
jgi:hypothetical protein